MGETVFVLIMYLAVIGGVFAAYVAGRNYIFRSEDYDTFKKGDQYVLLILLYMFFFFMSFHIDGLYRRFMILDNYYFRYDGFIWIPFTYLSKCQDYMTFLDQVGQESISLLTFVDFVKYYTQLLMLTLPLSYLIQKLNKRKAFGLIFTMVILGIGFGLSQTVYIGDGIALGAIGYLLLLGIGRAVSISKVVDQQVEKKRDLLNYLVFGGLVIVVLLWVMHFEYTGNDNEKLVKKLAFEQELLTYNDLIRVNFNQIALYEGGRFGKSLVFSGQLDFDEALFENCSPELREVLSQEDVRVSHEYSFEGKHQGFGSNQTKFTDDIVDYAFHTGLQFRDYETTRYDEKGKFIEERLRENHENAAFFEYYGISEVAFNLKKHTELSEFEILNQGFVRDDYLYYEVTYKTKKYPDIDFKWFANTTFMDEDGERVRSDYSDESILEEGKDYMVKRERYYFYKDIEKQVKDIKTEVYGGQLKLETVEEELLFSIDREIFQ